MRIAITNFDMPWSLLGGTEIHVDRIARSLVRDHGDTVTLFTRRAPPDDADVPYEVVVVPTSRTLEHVVRPYYRYRMLYGLRFSRLATEAILNRRDEFDVVNLQGYSAFPTKLRHAARVSTIHVTFELAYRDGRAQMEEAGTAAAPRRLVQDWIYRRQRRWARNYFEAVDDVVCVAPDVAEFLRREHDVEPTVIPNAVDPPGSVPGREDAKADLDLDRFERVILFLGRLDPVKRPLSLLPYARGATGVVFGGTGPLAQTIERESRGNPNVVYAGRVPEDKKSLYFRAADVFALPSRAEGQPIAIMEALGHGTPVYTTRPEWVPAELHEYCTFGALEPNLERAFGIRVPAGVVPTWRDVASRIRDVFQAAAEKRGPTGTNLG